MNTYTCTVHRYIGSRYSPDKPRPIEECGTRTVEAKDVIEAAQLAALLFAKFLPWIPQNDFWIEITSESIGSLTLNVGIEINVRTWEAKEGKTAWR